MSNSSVHMKDSLIRNSYYRASRAYRVYCTRPEGAKRPRASTINTLRNIEAL